MSWPIPPTGPWNPGMSITPDVGMGSYTPEQWAVMQQNWQQWSQWQQQYSQWQMQYGDKYAQQMQVMQNISTVPPAPPVNAVPPPVPPPPDKPPPPPPPHENNQPLYRQNVVAPPPPKSQPPPPVATTTANPQWTKPSYNTNKNESGTGQAWSSNTDKAAEGTIKQNLTQSTASSVNAEALKKLAEEEKQFDIKFKQWEQEIQKWREENKNHPDKEQYQAYEDKFEAFRVQLMERRNHMKLKRDKLMSSTPQTSNTTVPQNAPALQNAPPTQNMSQNDNIVKHQSTSNQSFPHNQPFNQDQSSFNQNKPFNQGQTFNQNKSVHQDQSFNQNKSFNQGPTFNQNKFGNQDQSFNQNKSFNQVPTFNQNKSFHQNKSYNQDPSFNQNKSFNRDQSFIQNKSFTQDESLVRIQPVPNQSQNYNQQSQKSKNNYSSNNYKPQPQNQQNEQYNQSSYNNNRNNRNRDEPQNRYETYSDKAQSHLDEDIRMSEHSSFLPRSNASNGIPGLDLMPDVEKPEVIVIPNDESDIPVQEKEMPDYSTISKGINDILGDEKIMNILSMVQSKSQPPAVNDMSQNSYFTKNQGIPPQGDQNKINYDNQQFINRPPQNMANNFRPSFNNQNYQNQMNMPSQPFRQPLLQQNKSIQGQYQERNNQFEGRVMRPQFENEPQMTGHSPMKANMLPMRQNMNNISTHIKPLMHENFTPQKEPVQEKWVEIPLVTPSIVVDYDHKPLRSLARDFIVPVHTFEYNHKSKENEEPKMDFEKEVDELFSRTRKSYEKDMEVSNYKYDDHYSGQRGMVREERDVYRLGHNDYRDPRSDFRMYAEDFKSRRIEYRPPRDEYRTPSEDYRAVRDDDRDYKRLPPRETYERRSRYDDRYEDRRREERDRGNRFEDYERRAKFDEFERYAKFDEHRDKEHYRERERERSRDRDRGRVKDWERDRERDKQYDRSRDSERERDRGRIDRKRSKSIERDTHKRERSAESNVSKESKKSKVSVDSKVKINKSHIVMIDDLLEMPGREMRPEKIVVILRGLPGSGKSYLAKLIRDREAEFGGTVRIMSIDDYFMQESFTEETDPVTGKTVQKPSLKYEYDEASEETYMTSLQRAFKRSLTDGFFSFLIFDAPNDQLKNYAEIWNFGRQCGFQVYVCTMDADIQTCFKRNIHNRTLDDIEVMKARFFPTPAHHIQLDPTTLLQSAAITDVHMEDVESDEVIMDDTEYLEVESSFTSKWEKMEDAVQLARLDGTSKPLRSSQLTMEDYLQLDDWKPNMAKPGKKTVRWADIEERREQEKMRAIGFVVGQTDWNRMTDPTLGSGALTQTKYIERVKRY